VQALLGGATAAPDGSMDKIAILAEDEVETLLCRFNATDVAPSQLMHAEQTVHGAYEHWAAVQPHAPALISEARWPSTQGSMHLSNAWIAAMVSMASKACCTQAETPRCRRPR